MYRKIDGIMQRLQNSVFGQVHLGPSHPAVRKAIAEMSILLGDVLRERSEIRVLFFADRVIADDQTLPSSDQLLQSLGNRLAAHQSDAILFKQGLGPDDIKALLASLDIDKGIDPLPLRSDRIVLGKISTGSGGGVIEAGGAGLVIDACETGLQRADLKRMWNQIRRGHTVDTENVENALSSILASYQLLPGSMIELIKIRRHDEYTLAHTVNVAVLASALGQAIGLGSVALEELTVAALLHDIGKLLVPPAVLNKKGQLDADERKLVEQHPAEGVRLLAGRADVPKLAVIVAYEHHRRLDGGGYPARVATGRPNLASQIVQVADIFDALRSHRPYRDAWTPENALSIMAESAGGSFDRVLFEVFSEEIVDRVKARQAEDEGEGLRSAA